MIFSTLKINKNMSIYKQICDHIIDSLQKGIIKKGYKLPSTRELSEILSISRNSVILAYDELKSRGIIESVKGKGSFISVEWQNNNVDFFVKWSDKINYYGKTLYCEDIIKKEPVYKKGMISFKSISPDDSLFNLEDFKKALYDAWNIEGKNLLNYGYAKGYKPLIDYLLNYMKGKGVCISNKDLLVTNGFTEGFDVLISTITEPGDVVFTEKPTHNTAIKIMKSHGLRIIQIPVDKDGIIIEKLEESLSKYKPKAVYLIPSYNNPTGIVTKSQRRTEMLQVFSKNDIPVIEDGFSEELFYSSSPLQPMIALQGKGNGTVYVGSLSKVLFPGLRIGWILGDRELIDVLESVKRGRNINTSFLDQSAFYYYLKSGAFERYLKNIRKYYKEKYNLVIQAIKKYINYEVITGEGALHVFVKLKDNVDTRELLELCYKKGVLFMPGDIFYSDSDFYCNANKKSCTTLRIGFGRVKDEDIVSGIKIISDCIKKLK